MTAATVPDVVDTTAVDETPDVQAPPQAPNPGTALTLAAPPSAAIISAHDPRDILSKAQQIAAPLKDLIDTAGLAKALNRREPDKKHVEVGGWQAAGTMMGALGGLPLHAETVWTRKIAGPDGIPHRTAYTVTVKRYHSKQQGGGLREEITYDVDGHDWEACVEIKTAAGVVVGRAEGMVSRDEETWNDRADYALRSMAETRAESRAWRKALGWIVHLAGYNPTPAEEMGHTPGAPDPIPADAIISADAGTRGTVLKALSWIGGSPETGQLLFDAVSAELKKVCGDDMPLAAAVALIFTLQTIKNGGVK